MVKVSELVSLPLPPRLGSRSVLAAVFWKVVFKYESDYFFLQKNCRENHFFNFSLHFPFGGEKLQGESLFSILVFIFPLEAF